MKFTAVFDASRDVADALIQAEPTWPDQIVGLLVTRLGADTLGFTSYLKNGIIEAKAVNCGGPPLSADERAVWSEYWWEYPFMQRFLVGDGTAARNSDLVASMRSFRCTTLYGEHFGPRRARFQANLGWDAGGVRTGMGLYRERYDFNADEIAALERIRQLMAAAAQYRSVLDLLERESSSDGRGPTISETLSSRQQVVLALVATGATDAQIARRLRITERTVRKHVGDIFRRLKVDNRVAAARWWLTSRGDQPPTGSSPSGLER